MEIFSPVVFPLSLGSLTGNARPQEVAERHINHLEEVAGADLRKIGLVLAGDADVAGKGWGFHGFNGVGDDLVEIGFFAS